MVGQDTARVAGEVEEQGVFGGGQADGLAADGDAAAGEVDAQVAGLVLSAPGVGAMKDVRSRMLMRLKLLGGPAEALRSDGQRKLGL